MDSNLIDQILAVDSPFDDAFDGDVFGCGPTLQPLPIWTHCGRRIDLLACNLGWLTLSLREVIDDAEANWSGDDDAAWDAEAILL
ncbi:hypothetical protein [Synechococcus sp. 8F6]|uniref:hypothetical protein n=1 Tax=Synechococcus sp. 8F6 TaxID=2025606 RepID=UPI00117BF6FF|nr:hypothetical protein [Synechococcus sp. 8F6]